MEAWAFSVPNDAVLPAQWHSDARVLSPERRLLLAVLSDALDLLLRGTAAKKPQATARLVAEARAWVAAEDVRWPFSFVSCCHGLGIEPQWLRRRVLALYESRVSGRAVPLSSARVLSRSGAQPRMTG